MLCKFCQNEFTPSKYRPKQQVCSRPECQRLRQLQNEKDWRLRNPDYFKCLGQESSWRADRHRYTRLWKAMHGVGIRAYEKANQKPRREYMREYMRRYRQTSPVNGNKS